MKKLPLSSRAGLSALLFILAARPGRAATIDWGAAGGGPFNVAANWTGGVGPGSADTARFLLTGTYTVFFQVPSPNDLFVVDNGNVTFALGGNTYTLDTAGSSVVGSADATTGRLTLIHGRLETVAGSSFIIGQTSADTGFVTVSTDAVLDCGNSLSVGTSGTGTLTVQSGGRVETGGTLLVGNGTTSLGTMIVSGAGSTAELAALTVGSSGTGSLAVSSAGAVTVSGSGTVGAASTADGSIAVSGAGSSLDVLGSLDVGNGGPGTLLITAGGTVDLGGQLFAGVLPSGPGEILVSGTGSRLATGGTANLGFNGVATLDIASGGTVVSTATVNLGANTGSTGTVTVSGSTASWSLANQFHIGAAGTGSLTISGGGTATKSSTGTFTIGQQTTSTGTLTVTGAGSDLVSAAAVAVGSSGSGTMVVSEGGFVATAGNSTIAGVGVSTSTGSATVTGAGSLWRNTGVLTVGSATGGNATLTAGSGGTVETSGALSLVDSAAAGATTTLNLQPGGTLRCDGFLRGAGVLNFTGGTLEVEAAAFSNGNSAAALTLAGLDAASPPLLRLTGAGASMANVTTITLGNAAATGGALEVLNGAQCAPTGNVICGNLTAGGRLLVDGEGSTLNMAASTLFLGSAIPGATTFTVSGSGNAVAGNITATGSGAGPCSTVVTGPGSSLEAIPNFNLGVSGAASLSVNDGGQANATTFTAGQSGGSVGTVTVDGADSLLQASTLNFGLGGGANGTVRNGGRLGSNSGFITPGAATQASVTVTGAGSSWTSGSVSIGASGSGSSLLSVLDGGAITSNTVTLEDPAGAPTGALILDGGSVTCSTFIRRGLLQFHDGTLTVGTSLNNGISPSPLTLDGAVPGDLPRLVLRTGAGTANLSTLTVGDARAAALSVESGANLNCTTLHAGAQGTGSGAITVRGGGSSITCTTLTLGGNAGSSEGTGSLSLEPGTSADCNNFHLHPGGSLTLDGGTFTYNNLSTATPGRVDFRSGVLTPSSGTFNDTAITTFLGPSRELLPGRTVSSASLQTSGFLIINGGTLEGTSLLTNNGEIALRSDTSTIAGPTINNGILRGTGRIVGGINNSTTGQMRIAADQRLTGTSSLSNSGLVDVNGGEFELASALTNNASTGHLTARDAILWLGGGLTNSGTFSVPAGITDVFGDVTNAATGRIVVSGGATAIFYDDVTNSGTMNVSASGSLVSGVIFLGSLSGAGVGGAGHKFIEGDARPGASPGVMAFGGDVTFGPFSRLHIELAGTAPGTQYDRVTVANEAQWDGALEVTLLGGFTPSAGQSFDILDAGTSLGAFTSLTLPSLPAGLAWDTTELYTTGIISVIAVPGLTFAAWAAAALGDPLALPHGNHDNDCYDNATEFALGLFPPQPGTVLPDGGFFTYVDGERLRLLFTRPLDRTGVTLVVQASDDLVVWQDLATSINSAPFTGPGFVSENRTHPLGEPGLVEVRDTVATTTAPRRQIRLLISIAP